MRVALICPLSLKGYNKNRETTRREDWKSRIIFSITILWFGTPEAE
jgi:hypothetical protein